MRIFDQRGVKRISGDPSGRSIFQVIYYKRFFLFFSIHSGSWDRIKPQFWKEQQIKMKHVLYDWIKNFGMRKMKMQGKRRLLLCKTSLYGLITYLAGIGFKMLIIINKMGLAFFFFYHRLQILIQGHPVATLLVLNLHILDTVPSV